ncbi:MAG: tryptophan synthase subunit beta [Bacteroidetes bacterium]|nr:tryptophan synthase subunit beta [Bacteroidota bacterium]
MTLTYNAPNENGRFGPYGGAFVPEILIPELQAVQAAFEQSWPDPEFQDQYLHLLKTYVGRPTALTLAERLSDELGAGQIFLKREDLCHTGAHKINNTIGQILLARRMGKTRIIAETGAGQHGVATATVAARFGLQCVVYMGAEDMKRQALNVARMQLLGAEVRSATSGSQTLKDATNEAIRDWVSNPSDTFYIIGSVVGPHPYPMMVRTFHNVIGEEVQRQLMEMTGRNTPDVLVACVGGGSNAIGMFYPFIDHPEVQMFGVEAAGEGLNGKHAATLSRGTVGVLHGAMSYLLQDEDGQISLAHSISAGLDYPGVGPEHSWLMDLGRVTYLAETDEAALRGVALLSKTEGIIPALETAHAIAALEKIVPEIASDSIIVVNCSGRGDKDMQTIMDRL